MKKFANVQGLKQEIDAYEEHFTGSPLLIGIDSNRDYTTLLGLLKDDFGKQILRMSNVCSMDFPPDPAFQISSISNAAKEKPVIWLGAAQAKMLYGQQATESFLLNLLGTSFSGPVTVLCPFCCNVLESIGRNYAKLGYNIIVLKSDDRLLPSIHVSPDDSVSYAGTDSVQGIKALLQVLEDGKYSQDILLLTSCKLSYLEGSMYPVSEGLSPYQFLCQREPGIAANMEERNGTSAEWRQLAHKLQRAGNLSTLCGEMLCSVNTLQASFGDYLATDPDTRFLCFVSLRACSKSSEKNSNESKSQDLSRGRKLTLTVFPKSAEFVEPTK